jgi:hypothetical protein
VVGTLDHERRQKTIIAPRTRRSGSRRFFRRAGVKDRASLLFFRELLQPLPLQSAAAYAFNETAGPGCVTIAPKLRAP